MAFTRHKWLFRLAIVLILIAVSGILLNIVLKKKVAGHIAQLPDHMQLTYDNLRVNSFFGNLKLNNPHLKLYDKDSNQLQAVVKAHNIELRGLGYFDLVFRDKIDLEELVLDHLDGYYTQVAAASKTTNTEAGGLLNNEISIGKVTVKGSKIAIKEHQVDSLVLGVNDFNLELTDFKINTDEESTDNSMTYEDLNCHLKHIKIKASLYDDILIDELTFDNYKLVLSVFELKTRYTREDLSRILKTERDHFDVKADSIVFDTVNFGLGPSNKVYVLVDSAQILNPNIKVFRDKLVNDNHEVRPLYGKMLRDLGIDLGIDQLKISNGMLSYAEKVKAKNKGGQLDFHKLDVNVENLGNIYEKDTTHINIMSHFMGRSHLDVNWRFVVQNPSDNFSFSGELDNFKVGEISQFTQPNLNVNFKGELKKTYFNINGNPYYSDIDLQVNFEDFQVIVLKKNGKEKNKFLSSLVNMFVSTDSDNSANQFYHGNINKIERDRTKSVFNFVWKNLESGLVSAMLGSGKKKD